MVQLHASLSVLVAAFACLASAQQVDYYFLVPPDANNIDQSYLQFVAGETIEAQWHNPGDPINLYLTWCNGENNETLLDSVDNTGHASIKLDSSYLSDCGDYSLTVIGVQNGEMDWGQPTGSLPFNIVDVDNTPNMAASLVTLLVTDTDPVGFEAATAFITEAVTVGSTSTPKTTTAASSTITGGGGGGGGSDGGGSSTIAPGGGSGGGGSSTIASGSGSGGGGSSTIASSSGSASTGSTAISAGADSNTGATGTAAPSSDSGLSPQAKVGVGVGVGVGVPLLAAIGALGWFLGRRSRSPSAPPNPYGIEGVPTS